MSNIFTINNTVVDEDYVVEYTSSAEAIALDNSINIPDSISITLDNTDPTYFDPRYAGSMFAGVNIIGLPVELYNDVIKRYIFRGKIKNITVDDSSSQIIIDAISNISDMGDITCEYINASDKTIAEIIYEIIRDNAGIPVDQIVYAGFRQAMDVHTANQVYANVSYQDDAEGNNSTDVGIVLSELQKLGHCHLYSYNNLIYLWMYSQYSGELGIDIRRRDFRPGTYKEYYAADEFEIKNSYRIAYSAGATISFASGSDVTSIAAYGEKKFLIPDEDVATADSAEYNILLRNATGAAWVGATAIERFANPIKLCEFEITGEMDFVHAGTLLNLRFFPFYGEPVLVIEREHDIAENVIRIKGMFLNIPEVYSRDVTPPDTIELVAATSAIDGVVVLEWAKSVANDHLGYNIYFSTTPGEWDIEDSNLGQSPVSVKPTALNGSGLIEYTLTQLKPGATYYFMITDFDSSNNESDFSNVIECKIEGGGTILEQYGEDGEIPEPVYHEYLEENDYYPWGAERDYTQWIKGAQGDTGPAGPTGAAGADGADGADGVDGAVWFDGAGAPGSIAGQKNGDYYLNTSNGDVYSLIAGTWTLEGNIKGPSGTDSDAIHDNVGSEISAITEKTALAHGDMFVIEDSADSNNKKMIKSGNAKKFLTVTKTADYIITDTDGYGLIKVDPVAGDVVIMLPTVADNVGRPIRVSVATTGGKVTVDGEGSETIDGLTTIILNRKYDYLEVCSDGTEWTILSGRASYSTGWINRGDWKNRVIGDMSITYDNKTGTFAVGEEIEEYTTGGTPPTGATGNKWVICADSGTVLRCKEAQGTGTATNDRWIVGKTSGAKAQVNGTTKNLDGLVTHNLGYNSNELEIQVWIGATAGTLAYRFIPYTQNGVLDYGISYLESSTTSFKVQTGSGGVMVIKDSGSVLVIDNEDWYYDILVMKRW